MSLTQGHCHYREKRKLPSAKATLQAHVGEHTGSLGGCCRLERVRSWVAEGFEADFEWNRTTDAAERQPLGPAADTSRNPGRKNVIG